MAQEPSSSGEEKIEKAVEHAGMASCPNCEAVIPTASAECPNCKAVFGSDSAWKVQPLSPRRKDARTRLQVEHPAFMTQRLSVEAAGWLRGPHLLLNGSVLEKRKGRYTVADDAGVERPIELKYYFFDPIPRLKISGEPVTLAQPLAWYELAWIAIPLLLLFLGGAIGGLIGALAATANGRVFRGARGKPAKYGLSALITVAALAGFLASATALQWTASKSATPKPTLEEELAGLAAEINRNAPRMVDEQTRLDDAVAGPGLMLTYRYTLPNLTKASMPSPERFQSFGVRLRQTACGAGDVQQLLAKDVAVKFVYREREGTAIGEVLVLKVHCQ